MARTKQSGHKQGVGNHHQRPGVKMATPVAPSRLEHPDMNTILVAAFVEDITVSMTVHPLVPAYAVHKSLLLAEGTTEESL